MMTNKNKVSQAVMDELNSLRSEADRFGTIVALMAEIIERYELIEWLSEFSDIKARTYEQAVIDYVFNDADNFEVKTPTWVIVSKKADKDGEWWALSIEAAFGIENWESNFPGRLEGAIKKATRITDPKLKDALLYANKDFEAIKVEE